MTTSTLYDYEVDEPRILNEEAIRKLYHDVFENDEIIVGEQQEAKTNFKYITISRFADALTLSGTAFPRPTMKMMKTPVSTFTAKLSRLSGKNIAVAMRTASEGSFLFQIFGNLTGKLSSRFKLMSEKPSSTPSEWLSRLSATPS